MNESARRIQAELRFERRKRIACLWKKLKRERPEEKTANLIAEQEGIEPCTVYDILRGRR